MEGKSKIPESDNMESLITSIKEQTNKLKTRALMRTTTDSSENSKKVIPNEISRTDLNYSKSLIDSLISDNRSLHEDVEDFRAALETIVADFKEVRRSLEKERLRGMKIEFLEEQLRLEKVKCEQLQESNSKIKEKYMNMLEVLRQAAFEISEQEKEDHMNVEHLIRENKHLREMLAITKINEGNVLDIDRALTTAESEIYDCDVDEAALIEAFILKKNPVPVVTGRPRKMLLLGNNK
jgi:hypothetical protein